MTAEHQSPGFATLEDLRVYWRKPSLRATRELANRLGLRRVKGRYPWHAIWAVEGLAQPAPRLWTELKLPHLTTEDLARVLQGTRRSAQRVDQRTPDASFPGRLRFQDKPKLWRQAQVNAWTAGLPVPVYTHLPDQRRHPNMEAKPLEPRCSPQITGVFNPFIETRSSDA
jgi:hypothetical protein